MITSVVGELHWLPTQIGSLFLDNEDHYGIEYWHDMIAKNEKDLINAQTPKK